MNKSLQLHSGQIWKKLDCPLLPLVLLLGPSHETDYEFGFNATVGCVFHWHTHMKHTHSLFPMMHGKVKSWKSPGSSVETVEASQQICWKRDCCGESLPSSRPFVTTHFITLGAHYSIITFKENRQCFHWDLNPWPKVVATELHTEFPEKNKGNKSRTSFWLTPLKEQCFLNHRLFLFRSHSLYLQSQFNGECFFIGPSEPQDPRPEWVRICVSYGQLGPGQA